MGLKKINLNKLSNIKKIQSFPDNIIRARPFKKSVKLLARSLCVLVPFRTEKFSLLQRILFKGIRMMI